VDRINHNVSAPVPSHAHDEIQQNAQIGILLQSRAQPIVPKGFLHLLDYGESAPERVLRLVRASCIAKKSSMRIRHGRRGTKKGGPFARTRQV
jgi:hypothetical protein